MRFTFLFLLAFSLSINTQAQLPTQWVREFTPRGLGTDVTYTIKTDPQGNVYTCGYSAGTRNYSDAFVMKRSAIGDTLWTWYHDGAGKWADYAYDLAVDATGNVFVSGEEENASGGNHTCFTAKLNTQGVQQWLTLYAPGVSSYNSQGKHIIIDALGNSYVAGSTYGPQSSQDWLVIKYNSLGVQQWVDQYNSAAGGADEVTQLAFAPNGNITACGTNSQDIFVKQYTPAGGSVYTTTWTNPAVSRPDKAMGMRYIPSGDLIVGGESTASVVSSIGYRDPVALSISPTGSINWVYVYTDSTTVRDEWVFNVAVDDSGNCYLCGRDYTNAIISRINGNGTKGWRRTVTGPTYPSDDMFNAVTLDEQANVYVTGRIEYPVTANGVLANMIVVKYSAMGDSLWTQRSPDTLDISIAQTITYRNGKVYAAGFKADSATWNYDHFTWILDTTGTVVHSWEYNGQGQGYARGQFVRTDAQNNVFCATTVDRAANAGGWDVCIIKYDAAGTRLWDHYYSSYRLMNDTLTGFEIDPSGNLILSVSSDTSQTKVGYRMSLVKMDNDGFVLDTLWLTGAGAASSFVKSMSVRSNGSIVVGGTASAIGGFVCYIDNQFQQQWIARLDTTTNAVTSVNAVASFSNGDILVGGSSYLSFVSLKKALLQRYDSTGTRIWEAVSDSVNVADELYDIDASGFGKVVFTGASGLTCVAEAYNALTGAFIWRSIYNSTSTVEEHGVKIGQSTAGAVAVLVRGNTSFVSRFTTIQLNGSTGALQWANIYTGTTSSREPIDLIVEPTGRVVAAGYKTNGGAPNYDFILVGYSSTGAQVFVNEYTNPGSTSEFLYSMCRDQQGNYILAGCTEDDFLNEYLFHPLIFKYGSSPVGIEENIPSSNGLLAYPNPSENGVFNLVNAEGQLPIAAYEVYTAQGQKILQENYHNQPVDLSVTPAGMYFIVCRRSDASTCTLKVFH